ncbi:hypothetical protein AVEN_151871-1 [Araneus ventricosus]|uniref:Uncharacterized protein n=1 Tax=Araneus ventricosus TaxID=182803 RepID=A0A4Y2FGD2_ARAVE|nr:hypothetical protein AVEN_200859-1 [Araneus ventricosus]GBM39744.1 hypothetical protein AVEN_98059-1 [Araneus ventricosus]GBM39771.1 hypothetical protein AVEN_41389-1 [Araneus ventricosus]GBM39801.1 hypothetical protein AVEN_151871-1 [Araneus ventricosus]
MTEATSKPTHLSPDFRATPKEGRLAFETDLMLTKSSCLSGLKIGTRACDPALTKAKTLPLNHRSVLDIQTRFKITRSVPKQPSGCFKTRL